MTTTTIDQAVRLAVAADLRQHREIAVAIGMTPAKFSRRLRGSVDWTAAELGALARVLGIPVVDLYPNATVA
jgi:transcriptional regulator with XRE-family HTH domain